jgi:hypothetical protein
MADSEAFTESLILPSNLQYTASGAEAALVQAILTWARRSGDILQTWVETEDQAAEFVRKMPGLVAALCTRAIHGPLGQNITRLVKEAASNRLTLLQGVQPEQAYRGPTVEVVCADHLGRGAPYLLYTTNSSGGWRLRSRQNFRSVANGLLKRIVVESYRPHFDSEADEAIGAMLYELFKNTEEHAMYDHAGDLLPLSVRAVSARHHAAAPETFSRIAGGFDPLRAYCETLERPAQAAHAHLFELSIMDAGPGFAASWTRRSLDTLTLGEEEHAVRECFGIGSVKGSDRFGQGLPHVMKLLERQGGFLRLRTGRLSFFVDYSSPSSLDGRALRRHDPAFEDGWTAVAGSLLTILIPMRR